MQRLWSSVFIISPLSSIGKISDNNTLLVLTDQISQIAILIINTADHYCGRPQSFVRIFLKCGAVMVIISME